jgi:hypothetical protein
MTFQENLEQGRVGESFIANYLKNKGWAVLPAYEIEKHTGKGPQIFSSVGAFVAPDMVAFRGEKSFWIEAKHKSVFTWHRLTQRWTTGIDLRHYEEYIKVEKLTCTPVWLMFYHRSAKPSDEDLRYGCPPVCPTGLFGNTLTILQNTENHRCESFASGRGHGRTGMVYWAHETLREIETPTKGE